MGESQLRTLAWRADPFARPSLHLRPDPEARFLLLKYNAGPSPIESRAPVVYLSFWHFYFQGLGPLSGLPWHPISAWRREQTKTWEDGVKGKEVREPAETEGRWDTQKSSKTQEAFKGFPGTRKREKKAAATEELELKAEKNQPLCQTRRVKTAYNI